MVYCAQRRASGEPTTTEPVELEHEGRDSESRLPTPKVSQNATHPHYPAFQTDLHHGSSLPRLLAHCAVFASWARLSGAARERFEAQAREVERFGAVARELAAAEERIAAIRAGSVKGRKRRAILLPAKRRPDADGDSEDASSSTR